MNIQTKTSFSKKRLLEGYRTLSGLWQKGLLPDDLELHYFLHWFALCDGNISRAAKALQIHRNNVEGRFPKFGLRGQAFNLRHSWARLVEKNKQASFKSNFLQFYRQAGGKPKFTPEENSGLTALWQTGFPFKTLLAHYALWGARAGKPKPWVQSQLGYSHRHHLRLLTTIRDPRKGNGFWLAPLKPRPGEIAPRTGRPRLQNPQRARTSGRLPVKNELENVKDTSHNGKRDKR
jgi:hypothetical protein